MSYYFDGPTYGIRDAQQCEPRGYCKDCGCELYSDDEVEHELCDCCYYHGQMRSVSSELLRPRDDDSQEMREARVVLRSMRRFEIAALAAPYQCTYLTYTSDPDDYGFDNPEV